MDNDLQLNTIPEQSPKARGKKTLFIAVSIIGLLIIISIALFYAMQTSPDSSVDVPVASTPKTLGVEARKEVEKQTTLFDVTGDEGYGEAYASRSHDGLSHSVYASLPGLLAGLFYEGWLVNPITNEFISTGVLTLNKAGIYTTTFSSETELYEGYDLVVVTLETRVDNTPEEHVLEGAL